MTTTVNYFSSLYSRLHSEENGIVERIDARDEAGAVALTETLLENRPVAGVVLHNLAMRLLGWIHTGEIDKARIALMCTAVAPDLRQDIFWEHMLAAAVKSQSLEVVEMVLPQVDPCWRKSEGLRLAAQLQNEALFDLLYPLSCTTNGQSVRNLMEHFFGEDADTLGWWDARVTKGVIERQLPALARENMGRKI